MNELILDQMKCLYNTRAGAVIIGIPQTNYIAIYDLSFFLITNITHSFFIETLTSKVVEHISGKIHDYSPQLKKQDNFLSEAHQEFVICNVYLMIEI